MKVNDFHKFYSSVEQKQSEFRGFIMKQEAGTQVVDNEYFDLNSNIKEEDLADTAGEADECSESEQLNLLCEIDCDSKDKNETCLRSEQNTVEIGKASAGRPVRKRKKCVQQKATSKKRMRRENTEEVETAEKLNSNGRLKEIKSKDEDDEVVKKYIQMNCEVCSYVSEDYPILQKHFREHHAQIKAYVRCCNKKLFYRLDIVQHAYKHDNPEFFKCETCQKIFSEKSTLSRHLLAVHGTEEDLKFHCIQCPKKFARQKLLNWHLNSHVPMEERTFICDQCPNSRFASQDLLKYHIGSRHRREANVCHVCAKKIRDKASFERHVSSHFEGVGPKLKCLLDGCDHWLKDENNLRRHMRLHTAKQKILTCDTCGRDCKDKSALNNHKRRVHSSEIFICGVCQKTFKRALYLREHMAQHTGEFLYKCPFCTRTFNSAANMHAHKKKMHPVEWDMWRKTNNASSLQEFSRQQKSVSSESLQNQSST
ncbi:transcription factor grauzone-like isoform X2 [Eurosta solidaginis]